MVPIGVPGAVGIFLESILRFREISESVMNFVKCD